MSFQYKKRVKKDKKNKIRERMAKPENKNKSFKHTI